MKIKPLEDRVVVRQYEAETKTAGGIVLPDSAQEKPQRGKVLACGPGKLLDSGERGTMSVKREMISSMASMPAVKLKSIRNNT